MKNLIIIGAGGYGREMASAAKEALGYGTEFIVKGFLDDNSKALDRFMNYPPIIGSINTYLPQDDDVFISALGDVATRRKCVDKILAKGGRFISIVHRSASLGTNVKIGEGVFIAHNVVLTADVTIGNHAIVFHNSSIGHDTTLGDYAHVYAVCSLGGAIKVGEGARIYPGCVVLPRRTIGANAVIGAGSTVIIDVEANESVFGSPAQPLGEI